jgi:hypothetical protein
MLIFCSSDRAEKLIQYLPVLRIRIRMFLGLQDPDPLVRGTVSGSFYHVAKKVRKTLIPTVM